MPEGDKEDDLEDSGENWTRVLPTTAFLRVGDPLYQSEGIVVLGGALLGDPPLRDLFTIHSAIAPASIDLDSILSPSAGGTVWSTNLLAGNSSAISGNADGGGGLPMLAVRPGRRLADVTAEDRFLGHIQCALGQQYQPAAAVVGRILLGIS